MSAPQMGQAPSSMEDEDRELQQQQQQQELAEQYETHETSSTDDGEEEEEEVVVRASRPGEQVQQPAGGGGVARASSYITRARSTTSALQNILSVLVGRGGNRLGGDSDSESSGESDQGFWPTMRRPRCNKQVKPDKELVKTLEDSDFTLLTKMRLYSQIPCLLRCHKESKKKNASTPRDSVEDQLQPDFSTAATSSSACCCSSGEKTAPAPVVIPRSPRLPWPIPCFLAKRELGDFKNGRRDVSLGQKCQIMSGLLPNQKKQLAKFSQKLFCGSYSNCGNIFMSACQDQNIRIYDTSNGRFKLMKAIRARNVGWSVLDTALSPDNQHLIYSSWCDYIHQVNVFGEEERHVALPLSPEDGRFCLFSLRFSQDGFEILGGANDGYLYLFDRMAHTESLKINAHEDDVNAVAFADDTTHILASGGDDGMCKIWDRRSLRESRPVPVGVLAGHVDGITFIDPRGDGRHLITNSKDQSIKLWDLRRFSPTEAVDETRRAVGNQNWDYRWQGVPKHLARRDRRPVVRNDSSVMTYRGHTVLQTLIRCHFSPQHTTGQRYIYTGCATGAVVVYDALTGEVVRENRGHSACVRDVSWHPYEPEMISSSWDFKLNKWMYVDDDVHEEARQLAASRKAAGQLQQQQQRKSGVSCPRGEKSARLTRVYRFPASDDEL